MDRDVLLADQRVVVSGGRIIAIEPDNEQPASGMVEIDARGQVLMPGLVDFHTHSEGWEEMPAYVAAGVTTIVTMDGEALTGRWREGSGLPVPNQIAASEILDGSPPTNRRFYSVDADHAGAILNQERLRGAAFVKIYGQLADPARRALLTAARTRGMIVAGHIPRGANLSELFAQGFAMVAHGEEYFQYFDGPPTPAQIAQLADITARAGVVVTPDLVGYTAMSRQAARLDTELAQPGVAGLSPAVYQEWLPRRNRYATRPDPRNFARRVDQGLSVLQQLAMRLHERGVLLLAGTDAPIFCLPGACLHEEIGLLAASGIGAFEALRAATANAGLFDARIRHAATRFGVVRTGMRADLQLLACDPRHDLGCLERIGGVMVAGRWYPAARLAAAQTEARTRIAPLHALVDRYERLITGSDLKPLFDFLDRDVPPRSETLNANVIIFDAVDLAEAGRRGESIALLTHAAPIFRRAPGLWNVLGRLRAEAGDPRGARAAFEVARRDRPWDAVTLAGLRALDAERTGARH